MSRLLIASGAMAAAGGAAALSVAPWFGRVSLHHRVGHYVVGASSGAGPGHGPSPVITRLPLAEWATASIPAVLGDALACTHRSSEVERIRIVSLASAMVTLAATAGALAVVSPGPVVGLVLLMALPALASTLPILRVRSDAEKWRAAVGQALPELCERTAILMGTGRSLTAALHLSASSMSGPMGRDLALIDVRLACGHSLDEALTEWADRLRLPAVDRLVAVFALHGETPDLGRLISREADATRAAAHRDLLARIDRRAEQVWIPVTIAALVPGAIFLLLPFFAALNAFSG